MLFLCFDCHPSVSCVPNVACITGLYIIDCHFSFLYCFLFCLSSFRLVLNVACISGFSIIDFPFCLLCCSFALIVVLLYLVRPLLLVSLDCLLLIANSVYCIVFLLCLSSFRLVLNIACISGFSIIDCAFCLLCCSFAFIVVLPCVVCPMLPVSLDCLLLIASSVFCIVFLFFFVFVPSCAHCCLYLWIVFN